MYPDLILSTYDVRMMVKNHYATERVDIMLNHKHYMDIQNMNYEIGVKFHEGDDIIIQEKVDGANASFQYNSDEDCLDSFSRNLPLSPKNDLRGFYQWVQNLDKNKVREVLGDNLRMFGEWLIPHTVPYPEERYNTLYCFDVFDMEKQCYLPQNEVKEITEKLGLNYVPVFYEGKFTRWDDYLPLVGKTALGGEIGEGIVIKDMSTLDYNVLYTKIVHEKFAEVRYKPDPEKKAREMEKIRERERLTELAKTIVTKQRVEKTLYKLVDEGVVPEDFSRKDMKVILRNLPSAVYYDCLKEEPAVVNQIENFGRYSGNLTTVLVKEIISEREKKNE